MEESARDRFRLQTRDTPEQAAFALADPALSVRRMRGDRQQNRYSAETNTPPPVHLVIAEDPVGHKDALVFHACHGDCGDASGSMRYGPLCERHA